AELKRIAAYVENAMTNGTNKRLVITSPNKGEGKTMLAAGLAVQAAGTFSFKVLAVDLHWRAPSLHTYFQKEQNFDDSQAGSAEQVLGFVQETGISGLDLLAAPRETRADRTELGLKLSREVLDKAISHYDRIVVDTGALFPPNRFMLDPMNYARDADGSIMVILGGVTPRESAKRASLMFSNSGARLIGVVMNQWQNPLK
uniref:CpsD/CapB family tyrosine-protein kinase n=1 Tax=Desulfonatronospira sp. TaxID=1962951 RepID=UPI0025BCAEE3